MTRPQPIENSVSPTKASLSAGKKYEMWPAVWPGVSMTLRFERADAHLVALAD